MPERLNHADANLIYSSYKGVVQRMYQRLEQIFEQLEGDPSKTVTAQVEILDTMNLPLESP